MANMFETFSGIRVYNGTDHPIVLLNVPTKLVGRKAVQDGEVENNFTFPEQTPLSAKLSEPSGTGALRIAPRVLDIDPLPDGYDFYIVSNLYLSAARQLGLPTDQLLTVGHPVYASSEDTRPVGCLFLYRN